MNFIGGFVTRVFNLLRGHFYRVYYTINDYFRVSSVNLDTTSDDSDKENIYQPEEYDYLESNDMEYREIQHYDTDSDFENFSIQDYDLDNYVEESAMDEVLRNIPTVSPIEIFINDQLQLRYSGQSPYIDDDV